MTTEENVCAGGAARTEHPAEAEQEKGSSVLGKFRSVNALAEAYSALQAEFTRRSQRLKELERKADNPGRLAALSEDGAEKLRATEGEEKEAEAGRSEKTRSVSETPEKPVPYAEGQGPASSAPPEETPDFTAAASLRDKAKDNGQGGDDGYTVPSAGGSGAALSDKALYEAASRSEGVRLKIIGDYLSSLKSADAPLMRGGTGTLAAPPARPASISEAGDMALRYFKKDKQA